MAVVIVFHESGTMEDYCPSVMYKAQCYVQDLYITLG